MSTLKPSFSGTGTSGSRNTGSPHSSHIAVHHPPRAPDARQTAPNCQCAEAQSNMLRPAPLGMYICRCTECRRQSSTVFGITAIFPYFDLPGPMSMIHLGVYTPQAPSPANEVRVVQGLQPKASESPRGSSTSPKESGGPQGHRS